MFQLKINQTGLDQLQAKLNNVAALENKLRPPMEKSIEWVRDDISEYKPKKPGAFSRLATPGQKRAVWAKSKREPNQWGPNGYKRSGNTGRKWTTSVISSSSGIKGEVGNNEPHAVYVHRAKQPGGQQPFHRGVFKTDEQVLKDNNQKIVNEFNDTIERELKK